VRLVRSAVASLSLLALGGLSLSARPAHAAVETFDVDAVHSTLLFRVKHMNASYAYGRFNSMSGKVAYDAAKPEASSVEFKVAAASVDTANADRDNHLRGPDFFECAKYPDITFKSTSVKKTGDNRMDVTGDLSLHGVTKPVTASMEMTGTSKGREGESLIGFEGTFTIKRTDFGMDKALGGIGDEVRLTVSIEANHK